MRKIRRLPAWALLALSFALFILIFGSVLIISDFPFLVISMAITTVMALAALVVALAWAIQHDL